MSAIDLNCDLGEGFALSSIETDRAMLAIVSSANLACGFHAGDEATMRAVARLAAEGGISLGAHLSYRDLEHFGRRALDPPSVELVADLVEQLVTLAAIAAEEGAQLGYVKPHGALYNTIAHDERQARDVIRAVREVDPTLVLLGLAGSRGLELAADAGLDTVAEAFADRAYTAGGTLVARSEPGAVLHDADAVAARMLRLVETGSLEAVDGSIVPITAGSICVHSDTPGAVAMAGRLREELTGAGVEIRPFVPIRAA